MSCEFSPTPCKEWWLGTEPRASQMLDKHFTTKLRSRSYYVKCKMLKKNSVCRYFPYSTTLSHFSSQQKSNPSNSVTPSLLVFPLPTSYINIKYKPLLLHPRISTKVCFSHPSDLPWTIQPSSPPRIAHQELRATPEASHASAQLATIETTSSAQLGRQST